MIVLVLAGGQGKRLWPLSRSSLPKQFLDFGDKKSLLKKTIERFQGPLFSHIYIVTNQHYELLVEKEIPTSLREKCTIIVEPSSQNTLAAIAWSFCSLKEKGPLCDHVLVTPSDHDLKPVPLFLEEIAAAKKDLPKEKLALFGVTPLYPETDYGYIATEGEESSLMPVKRFIEKPSLRRAKKYFLAENYLWNTGLFLLHSSLFPTLLKKHSPGMYTHFHAGLEAMEQRFSQFPADSIERVIFEHASSVLVKKLPISWSDMGSWERMYASLAKDENGNVFQGNIRAEDTSSCLIFSEKKSICTIGLENLMIIETNDTIFVSKRLEGKSAQTLSLLKKHSEAL